MRDTFSAEMISLKGKNGEGAKYTALDIFSLFASFMVIVVLPLIVVVRKVYKNYSSMIMISVLELMAINYVVMASLRLSDFFPNQLDAERATYINDVACTFAYSAVAWLLLL